MRNKNLLLKLNKNFTLFSCSLAAAVAALLCCSLQCKKAAMMSSTVARNVVSSASLRGRAQTKFLQCMEEKSLLPFTSSQTLSSSSQSRLDSGIIDSFRAFAEYECIVLNGTILNQLLKCLSFRLLCRRRLSEWNRRAAAYY